MTSPVVDRVWRICRTLEDGKPHQQFTMDPPPYSQPVCGMLVTRKVPRWR